MSRNNDLINLLRNIKHTSVSKIDMKYNKIFKDYNIDTLVEHNKFANKVRKKWKNDYEFDSTFKSKIRTTNDKLNQIINTNRNAAKIQELFFKTFDKEPIFKKILKKDYEKAKTNNNIASKIQNIIENRKKFNISNTFLKRRYEENNRQPPVCLYSPKYTYIYKHMPGFNFHREKTISRKKIILDINDKNQISKENNNNMNQNDYKIKKLINNSKSYNKIHNLTPLNISKKKVNLSIIDDNSKEIIKEFEENKDFTHINTNQKNFFLSQQYSPLKKEIEKKTPQYYSPKYINKNILVPDFDKMLPRFLEKTKKPGYLSNADYSPNYNAIFSGVLNNKPVDLKRRRKYYNLKKIITIYNPRAEYLLFPQLNIKE